MWTVRFIRLQLICSINSKLWKPWPWSLDKSSKFIIGSILKYSLKHVPQHIIPQTQESIHCPKTDAIWSTNGLVIKLCINWTLWSSNIIIHHMTKWFLYAYLRGDILKRWISFWIHQGINCWRFIPAYFMRCVSVSWCVCWHESVAVYTVLCFQK